MTAERNSTTSGDFWHTPPRRLYVPVDLSPEQHDKLLTLLFEHNRLEELDARQRGRRPAPASPEALAATLLLLALDQA